MEEHKSKGSQYEANLAAELGISLGNANLEPSPSEMNPYEDNANAKSS